LNFFVYQLLKVDHNITAINGRGCLPTKCNVSILPDVSGGQVQFLLGISRYFREHFR